MFFAAANNEDNIRYYKLEIYFYQILIILVPMFSEHVYPFLRTSNHVKNRSVRATAFAPCRRLQQNTRF